MLMYVNDRPWQLDKGFRIVAGHADFLTALAVSVVTWRDRQGAEHYVAVRGGMIEVRGGQTITVATPEAVAGDDLHQLETEVLVRFRRQLEEEQAAVPTPSASISQRYARSAAC